MRMRTRLISMTTPTAWNAMPTMRQESTFMLPSSVDVLPATAWRTARMLVMWFRKAANFVVWVECHQPATLQYSHFPYANGMYTRCHDPHSAANPHLLRGKANDLCLSCHLRKAESTASRYMPTIILTSENRMDTPTSVIP